MLKLEVSSLPHNYKKSNLDLIIKVKPIFILLYLVYIYLKDNPRTKDHLSPLQEPNPNNFYYMSWVMF